MACILFIEPDRILAETYVQSLVAYGHEVIAASSAQQAIMAADHSTPEVVVLELQLVEHSGIEFLYEFRSYVDWRNIPIIIQSHVPPVEFTSNWELLRNELGVKQYLYKPQTTLRDLRRAIADVRPVAA